MPLVLADRVKETTSTSGTGTLTLDGAATGFQSFAVIGNGNTTYYTISSTGSSEWEVGIGTYTSSGTTLSRDTVLASSAGAPTKTNFSAGTKDVFVTYTAARSVNVDGSTIDTFGLGASAGQILYCSATNTFSLLNAGTSGQVLTSGGAGAPTWTTATNANTASAIVQRDGSGNFSAGTITASLTGTASGNLPLTGGTLTGELLIQTANSSSQQRIKKTSQSGYGVLAWDGVVYHSYNIYYSGGSWVQDAPSGNNNNALFGISPGTGATWYASNNGTGSWNVASNVTLWNTSGAWTGPIASIPAGTAMVFVQTAAPTGWTKSTTHDNKALRVVSGTAASGGTVAFTTAFASQAVSGSIGNTTATNQAQTATNVAQTQGGSVSLSTGGSVSSFTLTTTEIPSHTHSYTGQAANQGINNNANVQGGSDTTKTSGATGGGGGHSHGFTNPTYSFTGSSHNHTQNAHNHTQDAHNHTFTGTAINLAVQYVDVIIATKA